jgi:hypothetical protein
MALGYGLTLPSVDEVPGQIIFTAIPGRKSEMAEPVSWASTS